MGFDPISLAMLGMSIYGATQAGKGAPSSPPIGAPAQEKKTEGTQVRKKRPKFRAAMDQLSLGSPTLGVAGNILS